MALDWYTRLHKLILHASLRSMTFLWILHCGIYLLLPSCFNTEDYDFDVQWSADNMVDEESWMAQLVWRRMIYYEYDEDIHMSHGTNFRACSSWLTPLLSFHNIMTCYMLCFCWKLLLLEYCYFIKTVAANAMVHRRGDGLTLVDTYLCSASSSSPSLYISYLYYVSSTSSSVFKFPTRVDCNDTKPPTSLQFV